MTHNYQYDLLVLGAGSGGVRASRIAASHGAKVALIEKQHLGGTCVNVGCVPKKLLAYAAEFCHELEDAAGYGWSVDKSVHSWSKLIAKKEDELERLRGIYADLLKHVNLYTGHGSFIDPHTIEVNGEHITADKILIATGGTPHIPSVPGNEHFSISDDIFYLDKIPEHIVIYGGGYIAAEFASIMRGLGSEVILCYRGSMFLRHFDDDIRLHLADELMKRDIHLNFGCEIKAITKLENGRFNVENTHSKDVETDIVLAATGRNANVHKINLDKIGLKVCKKGMIPVNEEYQTSHPHIYAVGDIISDIQLTPVAIAEAHYLVDHLFADKNKPHQLKPNYNIIPTAIFTNPQVGTVGTTEAEAIQKHGEDKVICYITRFRPMKYTLPDRQTKTLMKMVVHKDTNKVLGIHVCGHDAAEITQGFALAIELGAKKSDFDRMIGIHPTSGEEFFTMRTPSVEKTGKPITTSCAELEKNARSG